MPLTPQPAGWRAYFYACVLVAAATLVRLPFEHTLQGAAPFTIFFPVIILAAWFLGAGPTVLAVALSTLCAVYLFFPPSFSFRIAESRNAAALALFLAVDVAVVWLALAAARTRRANERSRDVAERLQNVTSALSAAATLQQAAEAGVEHIAAALGAAGGALCLLDAAGETLELVAFCGAPPERLEGYRRIPLATEVPATEAIRLRRPVLVGSPQEIAGRYPQLVGSVDRRYRAWAAVPLLIEARAIGAAWFLFTEPRLFSADDERLMVSIGQQGAQAIVRARLLEAERRARVELAGELGAMHRLHEVSTSLGDGTSLEPLLQKILDAAVDLQAADRGMIHLYDPGRGLLELVVQNNFSAEVLEGLRTVAPGLGACGTAVSGRARVIVEDATTDPRFAPLRQQVLAAGFRGVQATPLLTRQGELVGMLSTHFALARVPGERELRLLDLLARQAADVIDRTRAMDAVREAARRKDEFLATLAHELRNPLAPMRTSLELIRPGDDDPRTRRAREVIDRQLKHLVRLVDDLMDVARVTQGKLQLRKEAVPFGRVLEGALETTRPAVESRGQELEVLVADDVGVLECDPVRLAQVFSNLLNNASKFTRDGGRLGLRASRSGATVTVTVSDTGAGIPTELLDQVFEPFVQSEAGRRAGGLGVGLALVKQLVELHGGTVAAASTGRGAQLTVTLPAPLRLQAPPRPELPESRHGQPGRRVLIVDDNRDAADSLAEWLETLGHEVRIAYSGRTAVEQAHLDPPEVVVLDIGLPDIDGHEVAQQLRATSCPTALIIALTGWGQETDRHRSARAGMNVHLVKPVDPAHIGRLLQGSASGEITAAQA